MTTPIKGLILRLLEERGYVLLKKQEYADLAARAHAASPGGAAPALAAPAASQPSFPASPPPAAFGDVLDPVLRAEAQVFIERARAIVNPVPVHAPALYAALRYLTKAGIPGDIVDCGEGTPVTLGLAATALSALGATRQRLVLFDVTADPRHCPETELPLWGCDRDYYLAASASLDRRAPSARAVPRELFATGYPADNFQVVRYPVDTVDLTRPIAFVSLTSETYEANRAAIRALVPRLSEGGVIAVEGKLGLRPSMPGCVQHQRDAVKDFLAQRGIELLFWQATDTYRLAVKP
jgi:O-methyltransferase